MNTLLIVAEILEKALLLTLILLSVWSVSIMIHRKRRISRELKLSEQLTPQLQSLLNNKNWSGAIELCEPHFQPLNVGKNEAASKATNSSFVISALLVGLREGSSPESTERMISSYVKQERLSLEKGLVVLSTLGANAAFIGLLGTVLGIIRAFAYLGATNSSTQAGSQAVMGGVSQALFATAVGLLVAIPAVVAFNIFTSQFRNLIQQVDSLKDLLIAKRY